MCDKIDTQNIDLKKDLQENITHRWIHSDVWNLLQSWYGGGPAIPRKVYQRGSRYVCFKCVDYNILWAINILFCDKLTGSREIYMYLSRDN